MAKLENFIPLNRKFFDHALWQEDREWSPAEAWLWMLYEARYSESDAHYRVNGRKVTWEKGQLLGSIRHLKTKFNWGSNGRVMRFLEYLKEEKMIEVSTDQGVNVITLINHPSYNPHLYTNGDVRRDELHSPAGEDQGDDRRDVSHTSVSESNDKPKPDYKKITQHLVDLWNRENETRLRLGKSGSKVRQVRQRLRTFELEEIEKAVINRANTQWVHDNNQQSNWDKIFYNDKKVEHWLHREPDAASSKNKDPEHLGYATEKQARKHAEQHKMEFKPSIYPPREFEGETWYKIPET